MGGGQYARSRAIAAYMEGEQESNEWSVILRTADAGDNVAISASGGHCEHCVELHSCMWWCCR